MLRLIKELINDNPQANRNYLNKKFEPDFDEINQEVFHKLNPEEAQKSHENLI